MRTRIIDHIAVPCSPSIVEATMTAPGAALILCCLAFAPAGAAHAQRESAPTSDAADAETAVEEAPAPGDASSSDAATPPVDDGFWTRDKLLGDVAGLRPELAESGITVDVRLSQFLQGVVAGARDNSINYGGLIDYMVAADLHQLGTWEGLYFNMHAQTRFGLDINSDAGPLTLPNAALLYPLPGDYQGTDITGMMLTQILFDGRFAVTGGKINAVDLANGLFPRRGAGAGVGGFMNASSMYSALPWLRFVNLSIFGGGGWTIHKSGLPQTGGVAFGTDNTSTDWDLSNSFEEGTGFLVFHRFIWGAGEGEKLGYFMPVVGAATRDYNSLDPSDTVFIPGDGLVDTSTHRPWHAGAYLYQTLWQDEDDANRRVQFIGAVAFGDDNPSFSDTNAFASVEWLGVMGSRPKDRAGVAFWFNGLSDDFKELLSTPRRPKRDAYGLEVYYNYEITPWMHLTPNVQVIRNSQGNEDTALILGTRLVVDY